MYFFQVSDLAEPTVAPFGVSIELDDYGEYRLAVEDDPHGRDERFASLDEAIDGMLMLWPTHRHTITLVPAR